MNKNIIFIAFVDMVDFAQSLLIYQTEKRIYEV